MLRSILLFVALAGVKLLRSFEVALAVAIVLIASECYGLVFSAFGSVFKQVMGACTLDVSLRLVCSGL